MENASIGLGAGDAAEPDAATGHPGKSNLEALRAPKGPNPLGAGISVLRLRISATGRSTRAEQRKRPARLVVE